MGRRPNPLILEYFERGPKLNDNSNRYPHTCKQCGENFPKGRIDSLTTHITKRCPAISESDRMRACLELHGIAHARSAAERHGQMHARAGGQNAQLANGLSQQWSALETLAEASRQVDRSENNNRSPNGGGAQGVAAVGGAQHDDRFEVPAPLKLEASTTTSTTAGCEVGSQDNARTTESTVEADGGALAPVSISPPPPLPPPQQQPPADLSPEERLQALLPVSELSSDPSDMSVAAAAAAAAAARLKPPFLDPQLVSNDESPASSPAADAQSVSYASGHVPPSTIQAAIAAANASQPWGEMTYVTTTSPAPAVPHNPPLPAPYPLLRGGVRMDTDMCNGRSRNFRSKFTPARRQEVKEVRKLGACIRCRILRKICSKGTPCDTCRKVLSPRVWMTGCVRSRLHEQLDLYSAGVQVVLSQNRVNLHKEQLQLTDVKSVVDVSHFPDTGKHISLATLAVLLEPGEGQEAAAAAAEGGSKDYQVIMINQDKDDVPGKIEAYMRDVLALFVEREHSRFVRVTLETALGLLADGKDELLRKAMDLWGLVESIDRERQWSIVERPHGDGQAARPIREAQSETDVDIYTMICMQLNAAAERVANGTSRSLLSNMDRLLADSKTRAGFGIYLAALVFLNCVEKSTWAFKAWEQDHLRPGWPLERDPGAFTQQGAHLAGLLRMLLGIRRALPQTGRGPDGKLVALEQDPVVVAYFQGLDLDYDTIESRQKGSQFSPADSRSLELMFCSHLLLPNPTS